MVLKYSRRPYYADFSVTSRCNLKCDFCSASAPEYHSHVKYLNLKEIDRILSQLDELGVLRVSLEGGEPFLRSDFIDIMKLADKYDFEYYVNTNATLITSKIAKEIAKTNVSKVCISIDGPNEKIHDLCRGQNGAFQKTLSGVRMLHEANVSVDGIITLSKLNADHLIETIEFIGKLGINNVAIMLLASVGGASESMNDVYLPFEDWTNILLKITDMKKNNNFTPSVNIVSTGESNCPWELYAPLLLNQREEDINVWIRSDASTNFGEDEYFCTAGKDSIAIDGFGNVYGCSLMISETELSAGNLLEQELEEIWNGSKTFNAFRKNRLSDIKGPCASCSILHKCGGGCRACAFALNKDIEFSDTRCPMGVKS
ncbi:radical SAM/SPASM domain-containing protein [Saccharibacillus alkalitolerans]|uniref:Radical SAM protein n=1 Tax=Saccharibacillus alkalitolerans TaxID=2705290 RepID=A0ABX0F7I4_9BACL|nr:radical SAM protein [Saccharibacillus alkalitolerans]NGZ76912.1 radical SAM protein [Saccharibacillus alkalitolerans]